MDQADVVSDSEQMVDNNSEEEGEENEDVSLDQIEIELKEVQDSEQKNKRNNRKE